MDVREVEARGAAWLAILVGAVWLAATAVFWIAGPTIVDGFTSRGHHTFVGAITGAGASAMLVGGLWAWWALAGAVRTPGRALTLALGGGVVLIVRQATLLVALDALLAGERPIRRAAHSAWYGLQSLAPLLVVLATLAALWRGGSRRWEASDALAVDGAPAGPPRSTSRVGAMSLLLVGAGWSAGVLVEAAAGIRAGSTTPLPELVAQLGASWTHGAAALATSVAACVALVAGRPARAILALRLGATSALVLMLASGLILLETLAAPRGSLWEPNASTVAHWATVAVAPVGAGLLALLGARAVQGSVQSPATRLPLPVA